VHATSGQPTSRTPQALSTSGESHDLNGALHAARYQPHRKLVFSNASIACGRHCTLAGIWVQPPTLSRSKRLTTHIGSISPQHVDDTRVDCEWRTEVKRGAIRAQREKQSPSGHRLGCAGCSVRGPTRTLLVQRLHLTAKGVRRR
jgi:hypothetical protein